MSNKHSKKEQNQRQFLCKAYCELTREEIEVFTYDLSLFVQKEKRLPSDSESSLNREGKLAIFFNQHKKHYENKTGYYTINDEDKNNRRQMKNIFDKFIVITPKVTTTNESSDTVSEEEEIQAPPPRTPSKRSIHVNADTMPKKRARTSNNTGKTSPSSVVAKEDFDDSLWEVDLD